MATTDQAFQWIINNASALSINGRGTVAQTATRENVIRSISRGGRVWRFTVTPSPGSTYVDARPYLARLDQMDRIVTANINFNHAGFEPIIGYKGDGSGSFTTTVPAGTGITQVTVTASTLPGGGYVCRAGDWIQIGVSGSVYQVVTDPAAGNGATVTLNRPVDLGAGTYTSYFGANVTWRVICTEMPTWTLTPGGNNILVSWSGDFVFFEDRT
jgi:hypothetical protein